MTGSPLSSIPDAMVSIRSVTKKFGAFLAVDGVSLDIRPNEFFALLGPSGCGKTTLLRMIAGLEALTSGEILIDGEEMSAVPANRRPVNMVFQSYAVFPHMSVEDNVAYGLKVSGTPADEIAPRVREALEMVQLPGFAQRKPDQLSGGQRQRVALARALVRRPKVLLLDEPLSALDAKLREHMQLELAQLQKKVGITFIIVTHDQDEALSMADRVAVMEGGRIKQIDEPGAMYENPKSRFIADFIGKVNLLDASVTRLSGDAMSVDIPGIGEISLANGGRSGAGLADKVCVAIRPEKMAISIAEPTGAAISVRGRVTEWAYYGDVSNMYVVTETGGLKLSIMIQNETRDTMNSVDIDDKVWVTWSPSDTLLLEA